MAKNKTTPCDKKTSIGGQALIEGIMMRGPHKTVMAVRLPDGSITTEPLEFNSVTKKYKILGLPIIRGAVALIESMTNGYKALMRSAEVSGMLDEEDEQKSEHKSETIETEDEGVETVELQRIEPQSEEKKKKDSSVLTTVVGIISMVLGVLLAVVLFMYLPSLTFDLINNHLEAFDMKPYRALFEGCIKIVIFVGYMFAVSFMKDIKRVFMYHGAEHKTIFCYEKGLELTVENVKKQKRFHPRCGTSFMILMLIVSIVFNFLLLTFVPGVAWLASNYRIVWALIKIISMPLMCGVGYELIKICGKHENIITKIISAPGVWLQHISTKEPDDSMIEVAIESLKAVIPDNEEDDRW